MIKEFTGRLILVITSLLVTFIIIEIGFRWYGQVRGIDFRLFTKELKNSDRLPDEIFDNGSPIPNTKAIATTADFSVEYAINSSGFRDTEYSYDKPPGKIRIVMAGDSFTFGEGVPYGKRFSDIAEQTFPDIEIINIGFPGASLDGMINHIVNYAPQFHPDYIFIMLNRYMLRRGDLRDITQFPSYITDPNSVKQAFVNTPDTKYMKKNDPFFIYKPNFFLRNSYLLSYLHYEYTVYTLRTKMQQFDKGYWNGLKDCEIHDPECDRISNVDLTERAVKFLDELTTISKNMGSQLVAFNIDNEPLEYFYHERPPFTFIDLHNSLREESLKHPLTFTYDHHYNAQTNQFIAKKLESFLSEYIIPRK